MTIVPVIILIIILRTLFKGGVASTRYSGTSRSASSKTASASPAKSQVAPPRPSQVGKSNVTRNSRGNKKSAGKFPLQRSPKTSYDSAFENKGLFSGGQVSAFGDSRDVISSGSMAASNAEYIDVGNDYVKGFDVGGYREPPMGFDR